MRPVYPPKWNRSIGSCLPIVVLSIALGTTPAAAQDRAKQASPYHAKDVVALYYDRAPFGDQALLLSMHNRIAEPFNSPETRVERALMFALGGGLRVDSNGERQIVWKGTLLDFDRSSARPALLWTTNSGYFENLRPKGVEVRPYYAFGATVIDYDRTTALDLDARWVQGRIGGGTEIFFGENTTLIPDLRAGIGLTSLVPGSVSLPLPGFAADSMINGTELVGIGRVTCRVAFDFYRQFLFSAEARARSIGSGDPLLILTLEGGIRYVHNVQYNFEATGFELDFSVRRQIVETGDRSHGITSFHTAIQIEI